MTNSTVSDDFSQNPKKLRQFAKVTRTSQSPVSVIQVMTHRDFTNVSVGYNPVGMAYDPFMNEVFVTNYNDNTVSVISDSNNKVVATIPVGDAPRGVACGPNGGNVFVSNWYSNTVSVISDITNRVIANISVGSHPWCLACDPNWPEVFVANAGSGTVSVISLVTYSVVATVAVGSEPVGVAYDSGKREVFVANAGSGTVSVISDHVALIAPSVSSSPGTVKQGKTSGLNSTAVMGGIWPFEYQWFSEAPGASSYSLINGATSSTYNFVTSTSTTPGIWSFILEVTDNTDAAVNSTAATITVISLAHGGPGRQATLM
jgi:YVTN family beta-propeller protein